MEAPSTKRYWTTLAEYENHPSVETLRMEEFLSKPASFFEAIERGEENGLTFDRRDFLKLGGVAAVLATVGCGQRPLEKIVPYVVPPEEVKPGIANYYAAVCGACPAGCGVVVKTREARPIKLEGNPDHPLNQGKLCARGQASILDLYDPDRARGPKRKLRTGRWVEARWPELDELLGAELRARAARAVLVTGTWHGPARERLLREVLAAFPGMRHVVFEPFSEASRRRAQELCYGEPLLPRYRFERAELVVLLGGDPLVEGHSPTEFARGFGLMRKIRDGQMSRIYAFEPIMTLSGSNADYRYPVRPDDLWKVGFAIAHELILKEGKTRFAGDPAVRRALEPFEPARVAQWTGLPREVFAKVAADLWTHRGRGLVYAGGLLAETPEVIALHVAANLLNSALENEGYTVDASTPSLVAQGDPAEFLELIEEMRAGGVEAVLFAGVNPAYALPQELGLEEALARVPLKISLNDRLDETSQLCDYLLPSLHYLEAWFDAEPVRGLLSVSQPTIRPLWDNRSIEDTLIALVDAAGDERFRFLPPATPENPNPSPTRMSFYHFMRKVWREQVYPASDAAADFETFWRGVLRRGVWETAAYRDAQPRPRAFRTEALAGLPEPGPAPEGLRLVLYRSSLHGDGSSMNNAWLLETPDPVSKIAWDNFAALSLATAERLGLKPATDSPIYGQKVPLVELEANGVKQRIPVHILPGTHPDVVAVMVGWGRQAVGSVGNGVGVNAFRWSVKRGRTLQYSGISARISPAGEYYELVDVQGHTYIKVKAPFVGEQHRPVVFETTLEAYRKDPKAGQEHHGPEEPMSTWPDQHPYPGHKWGMVIDLNACIGCSACMLACQAENNVAVVGKQEALRGREMHWIRIDRYYSGDPANPQVVYQPMMCQHCDYAPCEVVCPVIATMHNDEGLNLQIYNRCVGTRYCSNNCPYKVRRFHWFEYHQTIYHLYEQEVPSHKSQQVVSPLQLVLNPDVTVRERGVMEKCTFCIQRIREAKYAAKERGTPLRDGELQTACQQTCPTDAIIFGDVNDPNSLVHRLRQDPRGYWVLGELNTRPAITYYTKVRNTEGQPEGHHA
ncbi:MAG: TAT-variant-translocated molybdopterin oxidoreductase [Bacteroidetes bacterium]|nr:TAT-variant-translocated molybdopterin oxidoreductase [Bacteroidota bacterium]